MDILQRGQLDIAAILESEDAFELVPVLVNRPRDAAAAVMIRETINKALMGLQKKGGKAGLAVMVMMPDAEVPNANSASVRFENLFTVRVLENPVINEGANGTGISAEQCAINVLKALHRRSAGGNPFYPDKKAIREGAAPEGSIAYDVVLRQDATEDKRSFVTTPGLSLAEPLLTITCPTSGAAIRYTLDGTFPGKTATLYTAPVDVGALPAGTLIRAAAYKDGLSGSDVAEIEL